LWICFEVERMEGDKRRGGIVIWLVDEERVVRRWRAWMQWEGFRR
jgi:hypothetical protein